MPGQGLLHMQLKTYGPLTLAQTPEQIEYGVHRIWGSCYNIRKAIFYLLKGDYRPEVSSKQGRNE